VNATRLIDSLEHLGSTLVAAVQEVPEEDVRWKPADGAWSILEIVSHLGDEEVDDFRKRVESTLRNPSASWPPIDPEGWAVERNYNEGHLNDAIARFSSERADSVEWLRSQAKADWSQAYEHPKFGTIRAGDLLTSWAAHDALHLRQIAKRMFQLAQQNGGEFTTNYAGDWTA